MPEARQCSDTALVAFARLCRARRCLVTVASSRVEYVLAEATRTTSLQYDTVGDPRDKLWLGTCSFPRDDGLTAVANDSWRRARHLREVPDTNDHYYTQSTSQHWLIVNDNTGDATLSSMALIIDFTSPYPSEAPLGRS